MAETYGELVCRLCQLRDQMNSTPAGRAALVDVIVTLEYAIRDGVTYNEEKEKIQNAFGQ